MVNRGLFSNGTANGLRPFAIGLRGDSQPLHRYPARALDELAEGLSRGFPPYLDDYKKQLAARDKVLDDLAKTDAEKAKAQEDYRLWRITAPPLPWDPWIKVILRLPQIWSHEKSDITVMSILGLADDDEWSSDERKTLSQWLDDEGHGVLVANIKDRIRTKIDQRDYNSRRILEREELVTFLIARLIAAGKTDAEGIALKIASPDGVWQDIYRYALRRSAWLLEDEDRLDVDKDKAKAIETSLFKDKVSLGGDAFKLRLDGSYRTAAATHDKNVDKYVRLVEAKLGKLQQRDRDDLRRYFEALPDDQLRPDNEAYFVARASSFLLNRSTISSPIVASSPSLADDYSVDYYEDATSAIEYDTTSVQAAAQLFYVAIWGDELGLFEVIDRLASQATPELRLDLTSKETLQDLQLYVLDERFRDTKTGEVMRRVPRAERAMFYRQVFGMGEESLTAGMRANTDFPRLWAVLMNATAAYIQKVEESLGTLMVSPQKILQAVEDIRYSLSMACSGMAKVASPVVYKEMDFVIRRLLGSKDVTSLVGGGSFWKVVERIRGSQGLTPLRTKGRVGHEIISMIATQDLTDNATLQKFVGAVEAYIVAESQLVQAPQGPSTNYEDYTSPQQPMVPGSMPGIGTNGGATNGASNWDF